jgi:hypothetical protein
VLCPLRDERNLYFGLLGPEATSLTYSAVNGTLHTITPVGPDGAYLIVQRAAKPTPGHINNALSGSLYPSPPITEVTYRNGLHCNFANPRKLPPRACQFPPGYVTAAPDGP